MKFRIFTILLLSAISLASCRKDKVEIDIKQYDQQQIQSYITSHGLTGMIRDTAGGDTTGLYYQIINKGTGPALTYADKVSFVFALNTLDGKYVSSDTIDNHFYDFIGHVVDTKLPLGLQLALVNDLKFRGASAHLLIPSHLAYGLSGFGTGSSQVANAKILGNESLDYYVHVISNQAAYDDQVIQSYIKAQGLTGYTKTPSGLYYSVLTPGTGTNPITDNTTITCTYTGQELDGILFDFQNNGTTIASLPVANLVPGVTEGLENHATAGTKISLLIPSGLGYGTTPSNVAINSCLRFTFQVITVTP